MRTDLAKRVNHSQVWQAIRPLTLSNPISRAIFRRYAAFRESLYPRAEARKAWYAARLTVLLRREYARGRGPLNAVTVTRVMHRAHRHARVWWLVQLVKP